MSKYYNPSLTTLNIPKKKMGKKAAEILLKKIKGEQLDADEQLVIFPTELIIRKSSSKLK
jgi:LacI family transcriptional regulator